MNQIKSRRIDTYETILREKYRPPSKGGNKKALHVHILTVEEEQYSFLALGSQQWVYKSDKVSFEFEIKGEYKNIIKETLKTFDKNGKQIVRGTRGFKNELRTADNRMPVSRREMKD